MEVTTVSPSPISPTEGDDLCEIDVTNVAMHSVTLLICLCGLLGNGAVLRLLSWKFHKAGILSTAFVDFLFLLFTVPSSILFLVEDVSCSLVMSLPYFSFIFHLSGISCYWALFGLTEYRGVVAMFVLCCCRDLPKSLRLLVVRVQFLAFFALLTVLPAVPILCPSQQQELGRAALISVYGLILLLCAAPMLISRAIKFISTKCGSKKPKPKRHDVVLFLIVLFNLPLSLCNFLWQLGYIVVSSEVLFLLTCIQSSIKPFIYFLAGRCWRPCSCSSLQLSLQRVFDEQKKKAAHSNGASIDTGI